MLVYYTDTAGTVTRLAGGPSRDDGNPVGPDAFSPDLSSSVDVVPCVNAAWASVIPRANNVLRLAFSSEIAFPTPAQAQRFAIYVVVRLGNGGVLDVILENGSRVRYSDVAWTSIRPTLRGVLVKTSYVFYVSPKPTYVVAPEWVPTATAGFDAIGLAWPTFFAAESYVVLRDGTALSGIAVAVAGDTASCSVPAADGASHDYAVQAFDAGGLILATYAAVAAAPSAPVAPVLDITPGTDRFMLTWASTAGAFSYALLANGEPTGDTYDAAPAPAIQLASYVPAEGVSTVVFVLRAISAPGRYADSEPVTATLADAPAEQEEP